MSTREQETREAAARWESYWLPFLGVSLAVALIAMAAMQ